LFTWAYFEAGGICSEGAVMAFRSESTVLEGKADAYSQGFIGTGYSLQNASPFPVQQQVADGPSAQQELEPQLPSPQQEISQ
jgi:hypothetical protein